MTSITNGTGPRWSPSVDPAAAGLSPADRRGRPPHERPLPPPEERMPGEVRRRRITSTVSPDATPDPTGNAGGRLDAFA